MVRYLQNPNLHNPKFLYTIKEGSGRLSPTEFTKHECLYLILTSLLGQEEIKYNKHNLVDRFESYAKEEWFYTQPYPSWGFVHIGYILVLYPVHFYYKFGEVRDLELSMMKLSSLFLLTTLENSLVPYKAL